MDEQQDDKGQPPQSGRIAYPIRNSRVRLEVRSFLKWTDQLTGLSKLTLNIQEDGEKNP